MDPILLFKFIIWIEPIYTCVNERHKFNRSFKIHDPKSSNPKRNVIPAKFIRNHFGIGYHTIHWSTYLYYISLYALFIRIPLLYVFYIIAEFLEKGLLYTVILWLGSLFVCFLLTTPWDVIYNIRVQKNIKERRKQRREAKKIKKAKEKRTFNERVKNILEAPKRFYRSHRSKKIRSKISYALCVEGEGRCFRKKSDVEKIDAIFANYPDFYYECKENGKGRLKFSVYSKEDNTVIYEAPVKNK